MKHHHDDLVASLTKNQSLVMDVLENATAPMSAYTILHELREHGLKAPLQVYRALDKLLELGLVHRLESLNAYLVCSHPNCEASEAVAFIICNSCGLVDEVSDARLVRDVTGLVSNRSFTLAKSTIELQGICQVCEEANL